MCHVLGGAVGGFLRKGDGDDGTPSASGSGEPEGVGKTGSVGNSVGGGVQHGPLTQADTIHSLVINPPPQETRRGGRARAVAAVSVFTVCVGIVVGLKFTVFADSGHQQIAGQGRENPVASHASHVTAPSVAATSPGTASPSSSAAEAPDLEDTFPTTPYTPSESADLDLPKSAREGGQPSPVSESGHVYGMSPVDRSVWEWRGSGWEQVGAPAGQIYAGRAGLFATDPKDGRIFAHRDGKWIYVGDRGAGSVLAVGDGLWVLSGDRSAVYEWGGARDSWTRIGWAARQLYAGKPGLFATDPHDGRIRKYGGAPDSWSNAGYDALGFAVDDDHLYGLSRKDHGVLRWGTGNDLDWSRLGREEFRQIYAGGAGLFATARDSGQLFAYGTRSQSWTRVGGTATSYAVAADHVYRRDAQGVWQWTGTGDRSGKWVQIGGPALSLVTSG